MDIKFPLKNSSRYTKLVGIRVEPEIKERLDRLKQSSLTNVPEAIRIVIRELLDKLEKEQKAS